MLNVLCVVCLRVYGVWSIMNIIQIENAAPRIMRESTKTMNLYGKLI